MKRKTDSLPPCKLIGSDGNVFVIIGTVARALRHEVIYPAHHLHSFCL